MSLFPKKVEHPFNVRSIDNEFTLAHLDDLWFRVLYPAYCTVTKKRNLSADIVHIYTHTMFWQFTCVIQRVHCLLKTRS